MRLVGPRRWVEGTVRVPPSKSLTNRGLILAAAAGGGRIVGPLECEDTRLLARALAEAGWVVRWDGDAVELGAWRAPAGEVELHLGNSGTGARLLMGLLATVPGSFVVDGVPRLRERPMAPLLEALQALGVPLSAAAGDRLPVRIEGGAVGGGRVVMRPGPSSQFVSSLVLAAPRMEGGLELELEGPIPSRPYLELTRQSLERFGGTVEVSDDLRRWRVAGPLEAGRTFPVEGDWSAAAFFVAAAAVAGGTVEIEGVDPASAQGDRRVLEVVAAAGCRVERREGLVAVTGPVQRPVEADFTDVPDLFPALAVVAAVAPPGSRLTGLDHLRHKESDRLGVMAAHLRRLGAELILEEGTLRVVRGVRELERPLELSAASDHRIAMALAVAALAVGELELDDPSSVGKSFPGFWEVWKDVVGP